LFDYFPNGQIRIMGIDGELGVKTDSDAKALETPSLSLPRILTNGGRLYLELSHFLEYCTPECSNALELTTYLEAMKIICATLRNPPLVLHNNNHDWKGSTFGCHCNYCTRAPRGTWIKLLPFNVASLVMAGSGWRTLDGQYQISQRARFMKEAIGNEPLCYVDYRHQSLMTIEGWERMHQGHTDAHMSEVNTFIQVGFTNLMVELLERNALPHVAYDPKFATVDGRDISAKKQKWFMHGIGNRSGDVIALLGLYAKRAREIFAGRDEVTDVLLILIEDTLKKLGSDPMKLYGRLDWVTKLHLINTFEANKSPGDKMDLTAIDLEYHSLNRENTLYYYLLDAGQIERLVNPNLIKRALSSPPARTRAKVRGETVKFMQFIDPNQWRPTDECWAELKFLNVRTKQTFSFPIGDPFSNYTDCLPMIEEEILRKSRVEPPKTIR